MEKKSKKYEIKVEGKDSGFESIQIVESSAAEKYARQFFSDDIILYESCFIMLLNRSNKVIGWAKVSQGGISSTVVDVSIVCKYVVDTLAKGGDTGAQPSVRHPDSGERRHAGDGAAEECSPVFRLLSHRPHHHHGGQRVLVRRRGGRKVRRTGHESKTADDRRDDNGCGASERRDILPAGTL